MFTNFFGLVLHTFRIPKYILIVYINEKKKKKSETTKDIKLNINKIVVYHFLYSSEFHVSFYAY